MAFCKELISCSRGSWAAQTDGQTCGHCDGVKLEEENIFQCGKSELQLLYLWDYWIPIIDNFLCVCVVPRIFVVDFPYKNSAGVKYFFSSFCMSPHQRGFLSKLCFLCPVESNPLCHPYSQYGPLLSYPIVLA